MFRKPEPSVNFPDLETRIGELWRTRHIVQKALAPRPGAPRFVFYEGPPTANAKPGVHHVLARSYKDLFCRYKAMQGHEVVRKAGWDTHGLPVELAVEKALGFSGKHEIEAYGVERFNALCRESVLNYESDWRRLTERMAYWIDLDDPYLTMTDAYIESVWWVLRQIWDRGLMYKGYKVVPYCPRCETPLSGHEVAQGYKEVEDPAVFVRFRLRNDPASLLVWTTTPWTLPANVALAVHPDVTYVRVRVNGEELILAKPLLDSALAGHAQSPWEVVEEAPGSAWVGRRYDPLFPFFADRMEEGTESGPFRVVAADFVTTTDGTGIVHIAPAYGDEDMQVAHAEDLPTFHPVDESGRYTNEVPPWAGLFVKEADPHIIAQLKREGQLFRVDRYVHTYPFCWRCDTPLLYFARSSWFIRMSAVRDRMLAANEQINWQPEHIKHGRFGHWLENLSDWALSRNRYWGTPLPVWTCQGCGERCCVGSVQELRERAVQMPETLSLHKPYVDQVVLRCTACGGEMRREPEVIDVWFDSGAMPVAQWHYPFENRQRFAEQFPADFICEAIDQTRGWFYSLLAISVLLFDEACYRNCLCLELVLDADGQKMSKSRGNVIDPWEVMNAQGADALRWYFFTVNPAWEPKRLSLAAVTETLRRLPLTLWHVYSFFATYAALDRFDPRTQTVPPQARPALDRWLLSRLHGLIAGVTRHMEAYDGTAAARLIDAFLAFAAVPLGLAVHRYPELLEQVADELNIRLVAGVADPGAYREWEVKPRLDRLGPTLGKRLGAVRQALQSPAPKVVEALLAGRKVALRLATPAAEAGSGTADEGDVVHLGPDDVEVRGVDRPGFTVEQAGDLWIALDLKLTPDLIREGFIRELIHHVQRMRKEAGLGVEERVRLTYAAAPEIAAWIAAESAFIGRETLAVAVEPVHPVDPAAVPSGQAERVHLGPSTTTDGAYAQTVRIDSRAVTLSLARATASRAPRSHHGETRQ